MQQLIKKWQQLVPADQLFLVTRAAQMTSDTRLFRRLLSLLDESIASSSPTIGLADIKARLGACSGTPLEPFTLSQKNLELGARLAQLAFSERYARESFRISSEQSIGRRGGIVLNVGGQDQFIERFMRRDRSFAYRDCWYWLPSSPIPKHLLGMAFHTEAEATIRTCEESAYVLEVNVKLRPGATGFGAPNLAGTQRLLGWTPGYQEASMMKGKTRVALGLRVDFYVPGAKSADARKHLRIAPTTPESIMRLTALLASSSTLLVDSKHGGPGKARLHIQLSLPDGRPTSLATEITWEKPLFEEIFELPHAIPMSLNSEDIASVLAELSLTESPKLLESRAA